MKHVGGFGGETRDERTKDVCHKLAAMYCAVELGCRRVCATAGDRGTQGGLESIAGTLREIVPAAESLDVLICLENHAGNNLENIEDYRRLLDEIDSPNVGICIDAGHFDAAGVDTLRLIDELGGRVNHIHLKENRGFGVKEFTCFGEGITDNAAIVEAMIRRGYSGYLTVELSPEIGEYDGRPFTFEDVRKPRLLFAHYETEAE